MSEMCIMKDDYDNLSSIWNFSDETMSETKLCWKWCQVVSCQEVYPSEIYLNNTGIYKQ